MEVEIWTVIGVATAGLLALLLTRGRASLRVRRKHAAGMVAPKTELELPASVATTSSSGAVSSR